MDALVASDKPDARAAETTESTPSPQARLRIEVVTVIPPATRHPTPLPAHLPGVLVIERLDRRPGS